MQALKVLFSPNRYAKFRGFALLCFLVASSILYGILKEIAWFAVGPMGGRGSWLVGFLSVVVTLYYVGRYGAELRNARSVLLAGELPCMRCGYPLLRATDSVCSECGDRHGWVATVEYWKNAGVLHPDEISSTVLTEAIGGSKNSPAGPSVTPPDYS